MPKSALTFRKKQLSRPLRFLAQWQRRIRVRRAWRGLSFGLVLGYKNQGLGAAIWVGGDFLVELKGVDNIYSFVEWGDKLSIEIAE